MRRTLLTTMLGCFLWALLPALAGAAGPYDEAADAKQDVTKALALAQSHHHDVLLVFGANWCPDCRVLDEAMHGKSAEPLAQRFEIVKINVGRFNANLDLVNAYDNPIKKGIPAVVVLSADNHLLYASKEGELADARHMGDTGIYDFLTEHVIAAGKHAP